MHWTDDGIVLSARPHGESSAVVQLLTRHQGRHAGLVRGGLGKRARGVYQPGNLVAANWNARLPEHLGNDTSCELVASHAAGVLDAPASAEGIDGPVKSTGGGCLDGGKYGPMAFQTRAGLEDHAIGWLRRKFGSIDGCTVV